MTWSEERTDKAWLEKRLRAWRKLGRGVAKEDPILMADAQEALARLNEWPCVGGTDAIR